MLKEELLPEQLDRLKFFLDIQITTPETQLYVNCNIPFRSKENMRNAKAFPEALGKRNTQFSMENSKFKSEFDEEHNSAQQSVFRDFKCS